MKRIIVMSLLILSAGIFAFPTMTKEPRVYLVDAYIEHRIYAETEDSMKHANIAFILNRIIDNYENDKVLAEWVKSLGNKK